MEKIQTIFILIIFTILTKKKTILKSRKRLMLIGFMSLLITGNFGRIIGKQDVKPIVFLSIFAFGAISAIFIREAIVTFKNR